jgi:hypothetical protein
MECYTAIHQNAQMKEYAMQVQVNRTDASKVIIMMDGGLGSQINKYIVGHYISTQLSTPVEYDLSWFDRNGLCIRKQESRAFELLEVFPDVPLTVASAEDCQHYKAHHCFDNFFPYVFNIALAQQTAPVYINGYYAHWKYYEGFDIQTLQPVANYDAHNAAMSRQIAEAPCSIGVHIRRGDYVGSQFDVITADYYMHAIAAMQEFLNDQQPTFFFFSTDLDWVQTHILDALPHPIEYHFVEGNNNDSGRHDFTLLHQCQHYICANSTFSQSAAFLGVHPGKQVIIPEQWRTNTPIYQNHHLSMRFPGWHVLSNAGVHVNAPVLT